MGVFCQNLRFLIFDEKSIDSMDFHPIGLKFGMGHLSHGIQNPNSGNFDFCIFGHFVGPKVKKWPFLAKNRIFKKFEPQKNLKK